MQKSGLILLVWLALLVRISGQIANQDVWVVTGGVTQQVRQDGVVLNSFNTGCFAVLGGCSNRIARDHLGNVYVARIGFLAPGLSGSLFMLTPGFSPQIIASTTSDVATDRDGRVWALCPTYSSTTMGIGSNTVRVFAPGTGVLLAQMGVALNASGLIPAADGGVWLVVPGGIQRLTAPLGGLVVTSGPLFPISTSSDVCASDASGRLWAYDASFPALRRLVPIQTGGLIEDWIYTIPALSQVLVDGCGTVYALQSSGSTSTILRFTRDGLPMTQLPSTPTLLAIDADATGAIWAQGNVGLTLFLARFSREGNLVFPVTAPLGAIALTPTRGDWTGGRFANLIQAAPDSDGDGVTNRREFDRGTDPLSALSFPPTLALIPPLGILPTYVPLTYSDLDPRHAGQTYLLAASLSNTTGTPVGEAPCPTLPLDSDALFLASLSAGPPVFLNFVGTLDALGWATASVLVPIGLPSGLLVQFSGLTYSPMTAAVTAIAESTSLVLP